MIFTKADRERAERIETALTSLGLNIGVRGEGSPLFKRIHDQNVLINEVVLGLDKLMQSHSALEKSDSDMLESLTTLTNGSKVMVNKFSEFVDVWNTFVRSVDKLKVTKPKRRAKSRKK